METATTRSSEYSTVEPILHMALELGENKWHLAFTTGLGQKARRRTIPAREGEALLTEVRLAKERFGLAAETPVKSCYEAGREGFWLHRYLEAHEVENVVVDAASIEVPRRQRQRKTDRLDVEKLGEMLVRYHVGDRRVWQVVRVPSVAAEDIRHMHRELVTLRRERTRHSNRLKGLLATQGLRLPVGPAFETQLAAARLWDDTPLPPELHARLLREYAQWQYVQEQIAAVEAARLELLTHHEGPAMAQVQQLRRLKGSGVESAWLFTMEFYA